MNRATNFNPIKLSLLPVVNLKVELTFSLHQGTSDTNECTTRVDIAEVPTKMKMVVINVEGGV